MGLKNKIKDTLPLLAMGGGIILFIMIMSVSVLYAKRFSYWMWYEDMVKETVIETLKERGIK